jgi:circadian clock protein KaiC
VAGLDDVLCGGFVRDRVYLLEGEPGTGKTTLGLQFLIDGVGAGEACLYVTLSETAEELRGVAGSHGWTLDGIDVFELLPPESLLDGSQEQSLLYASDLELGEATRGLLEAMARFRPSRVVVDSLSEFRLLAQGSLRYRRQLLALKHAFAKNGATVLLLDDLTSEPGDKTVHSITHGVVRLEELAPDYGAERRRLRVLKYRGTRFRGGNHDYTIETGGVRLFPRLVSAEHHTGFSHDLLSSEIAELDALLGGGIERGTSTLVLGPAGTGKSVLTLSFAVSAVRRGERALMCLFDEEISLVLNRARSFGFGLDARIADGSLVIEAVDAAEVSPGAFAHRIRAHVDAGVRTVVVDSLNGYRAAMPGEHYLELHMHELLQFLNRRSVSTFLTIAQHGLIGEMRTPVDLTYLADTVIMLRYFEATGRVRRAISVIKKRAGSHEDTVREYRIDAGGIRIGEPLTQFQGVLRGVPVFSGQDGMLIPDREE